MSKEAPTFVPPAVQHDHAGPSCHYHGDSDAVTRCARCGKNICQDCADTFKVVNHELAGQSLCYDCCKEIVGENVKTLKRNRIKILIQFITTIVGVIMGIFMGPALAEGFGMPEGGAIMSLIGALVFGSLLQYGKFVVKMFLKMMKGQRGDNFAISLVMAIFIAPIFGIIPAAIWTIKKLFTYTIYLIRTSRFISSDSAALARMEEYMQYTLARSANANMSLDDMLAAGGALEGNSFAQLVFNKGEDAANGSIRDSVNLFNEHGEIIRNFK